MHEIVHVKQVVVGGKNAPGVRSYSALRSRWRLKCVASYCISPNGVMALGDVTSVGVDVADSAVIDSALKLHAKNTRDCRARNFGFLCR